MGWAVGQSAFAVHSRQELSTQNCRPQSAFTVHSTHSPTVSRQMGSVEGQLEDANERLGVEAEFLELGRSKISSVGTVLNAT